MEDRPTEGPAADASSRWLGDAGPTCSPSALFYRNRTRARLSVLVLGALLVVVLGFVTWGLLDPQGLTRLVEESWNQRLVVALPYALLCLPGLLALTVMEGMRAADERPLLVLDQKALFYRDWRCGPVLWGDVSDCERVEVEMGGRYGPRYESFLEVRLSDAVKYLREVHGGGEFSASYQRRYFRIPLNRVEGDGGGVVRAVEAGLRAWRESHRGREPEGHSPL